MLNTLKQKKQQGFTIIEVMIVLAIAGLIMVVVLVAVPQLQRSQRNNATTAVLDRVFTELSNYASNNRGDFPDASNIDDFCENYLSFPSGSNCSAGSDAAEFVEDPNSGSSIAINVDSSGTVARSAEDLSAPSREIVLHTGASGFQCEGESVTSTDAGGARRIAATIRLEGGSVACRDNQ